MKKQLLSFCLVAITFFSTNIAKSQTDTEFWLSIPEVNRYHMNGTDANINPPSIGNYGAPVYLNLTSYEKSATVTISMPANSFNFHSGTPLIISLPANTTQRVDLSSYVADNVSGVNSLTSMENRLKWTTSNLASPNPYINKNNKGILIQSDNNITAYYEIGILNNMELISLKGRNALGTKFYVPFQTTNNTRAYNYNYRPYSSIDIVATEDNTKINITTAQPIWVRGVGSKAAGTHTIWLNKGETSIIAPYEVQTGFDYQTSYSKDKRLSGSYVEVDQTEGSGAPITIISHDDLVSSNFSANPDYVADQIVPTDNIGSDYAIIQGVGYNSTEIEDAIFVVGTQPNTNITVKTGPTATVNNYTINAGTTQSFLLNNSGYNVATVKSDKPVYVFHMSGVGRQKAGALIPTISNCTGSSRIAFNRTKGAPYKLYINILVWNNAVGKFRLSRNGLIVTSPEEQAVLNEINNPTNYKALPETSAPFSNWLYARIDASALNTNVAYLLSNTENMFHLGVINGDTNENAFYGYFSGFNQFKVEGSAGTSVSPEVKLCYGESTQLFATGGTKFNWTPTDFLDDPNSCFPKVINPTTSIKYKVVSQGACNLKDSAYVQVNVSAPITASFTTDTLYGSGDLTVNFENTSVGSPLKLTWYWKVKGQANLLTTFKTSNLLAVPLPIDAHKATHTFSNNSTNPITYTVIMMAESTVCNKIDSIDITVYPNFGFNPSADVVNGCNPLTVQFYANKLVDSNFSTIVWDFGDGSGSTANNPIHTFTNLNSTSIVFTVKATLTDQWNIETKEATINITVQPFIKASFVVDKAEGCSPLNINITNDSRGAISHFFWDRDGDGIDDFSGEGSGTRVYTNPTTANTSLAIPIRLRVSNTWGCTDEVTRTISVFPKAVINSFNLDNHGNALGCSPLNMDFNATTINATNYKWLIDGNAINNTKNASYTFENFESTSTIKAITFIADNQYGCSASQSQPINIQPFVDAQFIADNEVGCSPLNVNLQNTSSSGSTQFQWYIDGLLNSTTTNIPTQLFNNPTITNIAREVPLKLVAHNIAGCSDEITKTITVKPQSVSNFTYTDATNSNHCSPFATNFMSNTINTESVQWEFGSLGSSSTLNPTFSFTNSSVADIVVPVSLTTQNSYGCSATKTENIIIRPSIKAQFNLDKITGCPPFDVTASATLSAAITNYTWSFDGIPYTGPNQIFSNTSNLTGLDILKNITLTVGNGFCSDASSMSIVVYPQVNAQFSTSTLSGCSPVNVEFINQSVLYGTSTPINNIIWDFGDNSTAITSNLAHTFLNHDNTIPQNFNVTLTASSDKGCTDKKTIPITSNPNVVADFNTTIVEKCTPLRLNIKDVSFAGPTISSFNWSYPGGTLLPPEDKDFDIDFDNADPINPINRTITLNVNNSFGCTSSKTQAFVVNPKLVANLKIVNPIDGQGNPFSSVCSPARFNFENISTGGSNLTYIWDFNDGETQTLSTPSIVEHEYKNNTNTSQAYDISLTARNSVGCSSSNKTSIIVNPTPKVELGENQTACEGELITLDAKNPNSIYRWSTNQTSRTITISESGFYFAHVTNNFNCSSFDSVLITFNPKPILDLGSDTVKTSLPYQINSNISDVTYLWNTGEITPNITVNSYGTYSLYATNSFGCSTFDKVVIMLATGIEDNNSLNANVLYYPNPATDELKLKIEAKNPNIYNIELIDQLSRVVRKERSDKTSIFTSTLNIQDLTSGMYLLKISSNSGSNTYKVIIQK